MKIRIITVGHRPVGWVNDAVNDYCARLPKEYDIQWIEIKPLPRSGTSVEKAKLIEANAIRASIRSSLPEKPRLVLLDENGEDLDSSAFGRRFSRWRDNSEPLALVIGGADGLDAAFKREAHETLRLSSMTLPHALVRVVLAEQLFRAWSLLANHPYHRA